MDHSSHEGDLARIGAESAAHINRSRAGCEDSRQHIADSREAVDRSLRLLNKRYSNGDGELKK